MIFWHDIYGNISVINTFVKAGSMKQIDTHTVKPVCNDHLYNEIH